MRIRFLVAIASQEWGYGPGQEAEFPDEQASAFIEGGIAEAVQSVEPSPEPSPGESAPVKAALKKSK